MNKSEWSELFTYTYPDGAVITLLRSGANENTAAYDDSSQILVPDVAVSGMEDEDTPVLSFFDLATDRHYLLTANSVETRRYGHYVETVPDQAPNLMISHQLTDNQRQHVKYMKDL